MNKSLVQAQTQGSSADNQTSIFSRLIGYDYRHLVPANALPEFGPSEMAHKIEEEGGIVQGPRWFSSSPRRDGPGAEVGRDEQHRLAVLLGISFSCSSRLPHY